MNCDPVTNLEVNSLCLTQFITETIITHNNISK